MIFVSVIKGVICDSVSVWGWKQTPELQTAILSASLDTQVK